MGGFKAARRLTYAFTMSPKKLIEATAAIGIVSKAGRYGGTHAHSDIAMSFATWISPEFQLYIMKDYRRLKTDENSRLSLNWNLNREIRFCYRGKKEDCANQCHDNSGN